MLIRLLVIALCAFATSRACAQRAVSLPLALAIHEQDRDRALAVADPDDPDEACVSALLQDQRLREVFVPSAVRSQLEEDALRSARAALQTFLPDAIDAFYRCLETVDQAPRFRARSAELGRRRAALARVDLDAGPSALRRSLDEANELDVSWRSLERALEPPTEPDDGDGWRYVPLIAGTTMVGAGLITLAISSSWAANIDRSDLRLGATGVLIGGLGAMLHIRLWSLHGIQARASLLTTSAIWALAAIGTGAALVASDVPKRFHAMGVGLLASGAVDAVLWAGSMIATRPSRPVISLSARGGTLLWSGVFG